MQFEVSENTRKSVLEWVNSPAMLGCEFLFRSRFHASPHLLTRQYARLVRDWVSMIRLDPNGYGTHSLRRTKAAQIYRKTGNFRAVRLLLGHTKVESTVRYPAFQTHQIVHAPDAALEPGGRTMIIGYARVSTDAQALDAQIEALRAAGAEHIFHEKISGARRDRPELRRLRDRLSEGDVLLVTRLDRLARSTRDLLDVLAHIGERGATFRSLGDTLLHVCRRDTLCFKPLPLGKWAGLTVAEGDNTPKSARFVKFSPGPEKPRAGVRIGPSSGHLALSGGQAPEEASAALAGEAP